MPISVVSEKVLGLLNKNINNNNENKQDFKVLFQPPIGGCRPK
jgi:hypothetical protein